MGVLEGSLVRIDCGVVEGSGGLQLRGIWRVEQVQRVTGVALNGRYGELNPVVRLQVIYGPRHSWY